MSAVIDCAAALAAATRRLESAGIDDAHREALLLLSRRLGLAPAIAHLRRNEPLEPSIAAAFEADVARRARREPAAYIWSERDFFGRPFAVSPAVLVPRPETEQLIEAVLGCGEGAKRVLDVGTGSGCIAVSLACERPAWEVTAVDRSAGALEVAKENAERHGQSARIRFIMSDIYANLPPETGGVFDIIVSNPPYVATPVLPTLAPELSFEPRLALDGGDDGLAVIAPLVLEAPSHLRKGGRLFIEIGFDQGERASSLMSRAGFSDVRIEKDFAGHDRIATGVLSGPI